MIIYQLKVFNAFYFGLRDEIFTQDALIYFTETIQKQHLDKNNVFTWFVKILRDRSSP